MKFKWQDYSDDFKTFAESCLDEDAIRFTGCDDGFEEYYNYWKNEPDINVGSNFWAKIIIENSSPIGLIVISMWEGNFSIPELIISPNNRRMGKGSAVIAELFMYSKTILGVEIKNATAVIFPNNIASQKAFEKSGFSFHFCAS